MLNFKELATWKDRFKFSFTIAVSRGMIISNYVRNFN